MLYILCISTRHYTSLENSWFRSSLFAELFSPTPVDTMELHSLSEKQGCLWQHLQQYLERSPTHRRLLHQPVVLECLCPGYQNTISFGASLPYHDITNITYFIHFTGDEFTVTEALKERKCLSYCIWNLHLVSFEVFEHSLIDDSFIDALIFWRHPGKKDTIWKLSSRFQDACGGCKIYIWRISCEKLTYIS